MKLLILGLFAIAAVAVVPTANAAPAVHFLAYGATSAFQQFGVSVVNDVAATTPGFTGGGSIHHFTIKGSCSDSIEPGTPCVGLVDTRNHAIPVEPASYWVVWVCPAGGCNGSNATDVWAYDSVDSTVAVRTYLASATSVIAPGTQTGADAAQNLIKATLFLYGDTNGASTTSDAAEIPADVYAAINNTTPNASTTDIRPEDALFATERANSVSTLSPWTGLGYGGGPTTLIGASIASAFSLTYATPVAFGLPGGTDPFTGNPISSTIKVFPVGEEPIVFIVNRTDLSGLGNQVGGQPWYNNAVDNAGTLISGSGASQLNQSPIGQLFGGVGCSGSSNAIGNYPPGVGPFTPGLPTGLTNFPVNPILREPLSGTENVVEYASFRTYGGSLGVVGGSSVSNSELIPASSQESYLVATAGNAPVNPLGGPEAANPPGTPCTNFGGSGLGSRYRALSTGEEVGKAGGTGVGLKADSIGYAFFSFGNFSNLANNANYGYLQLDGVDPIFNNYAGGDPGQPATTPGVLQGELPACNPADNGSPGGCLRTDIWTAGNSYPHLRDGTYRSWAILRVLCDTANVHCLTSSDAYGTEAIIAHAQDDIHNGLPAVAVADFLPFSDDESFGPTGTQFGDASYIRSHYAFTSALGTPNDQYPGSHTTPSFSILPAGLNPNQANGTGGSPEAGGDAGGCVVLAIANGTVTSQVFDVTSTLVTNGGTKTKFFYTPLGANALVGQCGPGGNPNREGDPCTASFTSQCGDPTGTLGVTCNPPQPSGLSVAITAPTGSTFPNKDTGVFQVTRIVADGDIKVRVQPTSATVTVPSAPAGVTGSANTGCAQ